MSYGGIRELERFLRKRTGLELFQTPEEKTLLMLAVELRNVYSHTRGVVSETTVRRLEGLHHGWDIEKGKHFVLDYDELVMLANNLVSVAMRLDAALASKFSLRRKRYGSYAAKAKSDP